MMITRVHQQAYLSQLISVRLRFSGGTRRLGIVGLSPTFYAYKISPRIADAGDATGKVERVRETDPLKSWVSWAYFVQGND
jgi:hypothetical protein